MSGKSKKRIITLPLYQGKNITLDEFKQYILDLLENHIARHYFDSKAGNGTISALLPQIQTGLAKIMELTNPECEFAFIQDFIVKHDKQRKHAKELWDTADSYLTNSEYKRKVSDFCKGHRGKNPLVIIASSLIKLVPKDENISCLRTDKYWHFREPIVMHLPQSGINWYKIIDQNEPLVGGGKLFSTTFREILDGFKAHKSKKHNSMLWQESILHVTDRHLVAEDEDEEKEEKSLFPINPVFKLKNDGTLFYGCSMMHLVLIYVFGYSVGTNYDLIKEMDLELKSIFAKYYKLKKNYNAVYSKNKEAIHAICDPVSKALTETMATVTDIFIDEKATKGHIHWWEVPCDVLWAKTNIVTVNMPRTIATAKKTSKQVHKREKTRQRKGCGVHPFSKKKASKRQLNLDNDNPTLKKRKIT